MTTLQDPIAHTCRLLREAADELYQSSTSSRDREDWTGEPEAKAAYDEHHAAADALEQWATASGAGGVEPLRKAHQFRDATKLMPAQAAPTAAAGPREWREALEDALSVMRSVSISRDRRVVRDGSVLYLQTEEWCKWLEDEIGPKIEALLAAPTTQAAPQREPSPTAGMTLAQRILHVGGRNNAAGYVEFGSTQAVEALVRQVLRDLPQPAAPAAQGDALDVEIAALESSCAHLGRLIDELRPDAERYQYLRERDLDTIRQGGVFAGRTPDNVVLNGDDLDAAIDAAIDAARAQVKEGGAA